jgi:predicted N-acetyltransferase YhbS
LKGDILPLDISIRTLTHSDIAIADRIVTSAFGLSGSRASEIERYFALKPNCWLLATYQSQPAGVVGATDFGPFTYLGMMTVLKELQRRGIGQVLLQHMLQCLAQQGISFLRLDASPAGFPLYSRFGFKELDQVLLFELDADSPQSPGFSGRTRPLHPADIQALAEFDRPIFGADRTALFQAMLTDFPNRAFATIDRSGNITGYLFAQSRRIGPWAARSPQEAEALLQAALKLPYQGPPITIAPKMNAAAADLLERYGFRHKLTNRHMQRGQSALPGQRSDVYGQTSFAVG